MRVFHAIAATASAVIIAGAGYAADQSKEIAKCSAIEGDLARLECFDSLSRRLGLDRPRSASVPTAGTGQWNVTKNVNPVDDSTTVTLILQAESGASRWGNPVTLILRCQSNRTELYISWNEYLGSEADVLTRVGTNRAKTQRWSMSTDSKATFYPGNPIPFIKQLLATDKLVAQVTPYGESPVTAVFQLSGLANAVKPLQDTCRWH